MVVFLGLALALEPAGQPLHRGSSSLCPSCKVQKRIPGETGETARPIHDAVWRLG